MRKPGDRVWLELKKEMGRSSNLVWVAALLMWLAFSAIRYSHWHPLPHHLLHSTWISGMPTPSTYTVRHPYSQRRSSPFLNAFTSWVPFYQLNGTPTDIDQMRGNYNDVDDDDDDGDDNAKSSQEDGSNILPKYQSLLSPTHESNENTTVDDYVQNLDIKEKAGKSVTVETMMNLSQSEPTASYEAQDEWAIRRPSKTCATVEEMGLLAANPVVDSSLRVREMIKEYFSKHGASHVRELPAKEFCQRGFVFGRAAEDGLGNDIYKILTASGLSIMLNRSLIVAEHGSTNPAYFGLAGHVRLPFGDYLRYSNQTFSLREVKWLWVKHDCAGTYQRPLTMIVDDFQRPTRTKVFCDNWANWRQPIIWFKGTTDSNALQFFLKNQHHTMRESARLLFGDPSKPLSRPNVFGELFKAFISPMPVIEEAVNWVLQGHPDPDVSVHMRMLNSRSRTASYAACNCIQTVLRNVLQNNSLPQIVLVSDTPEIVEHLKEQLEGFAQVIHFDYNLFMKTQQNLSKVLSGNYFQPPKKRVKDWGSMPRWVAIVDMFLAARAKVAVISGANRRVGTTYVQLLASLAAAMRIGENTSMPFKFYSSFQPSLIAEGLIGQRGWGHTWRRFAGRLSCRNQTRQCAQTPLLPYAWWDGPWQSPARRDAQRMLTYGVKLLESGQVKEDDLPKTCMSRKAPLERLRLMLPSCEQLKLCRQ